MLFTSCFECNTQFVQAQIWDIPHSPFLATLILPAGLKTKCWFQNLILLFFLSLQMVFHAESGWYGELRFVCCGWLMSDWVMAQLSMIISYLVLDFSNTFTLSPFYLSGPCTWAVLAVFHWEFLLSFLFLSEIWMYVKQRQWVACFHAFSLAFLLHMSVSNLL